MAVRYTVTALAKHLNLQLLSALPSSMLLTSLIWDEQPPDDNRLSEKFKLGK